MDTIEALDYKDTQQFCMDIVDLLQDPSTILDDIALRVKMSAVVSTEMARLLASFIVDAHKFYNLSSDIQQTRLMHGKGPVDHLIM